MITNVSRRCFLKSTAAGCFVVRGAAALAERLSAATAPPALGLKSKVRIGKVYLGRAHPGWPTDTVDLKADMKRFEAEPGEAGRGAGGRGVRGGRADCQRAAIGGGQGEVQRRGRHPGDSPDDGHRGSSCRA